MPQVSNFILVASTCAEGQTEATLVHHLQSFGTGDVDEIMKDYTENSVLITPDGALRGLDEIRPLFEKLTGEILPPGSDFEMLQQVIEGEIAYIAWNAESANYNIPLGTDTFLIRDGKILTQTFAGQVLPKE
ncbi:MAG: nuclear transport factor 2 family protein [Candidatus Poribacteria bacterium]|nr:nuclear transport factor 2 family protein [Candidatus Poribacteria bacterium]